LYIMKVLVAPAVNDGIIHFSTPLCFFSVPE